MSDLGSRVIAPGSDSSHDEMTSPFLVFRGTGHDFGRFDIVPFTRTHTRTASTPDRMVYLPLPSLLLSLRFSIPLLLCSFITTMPSSEGFAAPPSPPPIAAGHSAAAGPPTHLAVVVHGLVGRPDDLSYLREAIQKQGHGILAHCAACNMDKTFDGVQAGGERLAAEVRQIVAAHPSLRAISFIGNSLGGIYSRYAISLLWQPESKTILGLKPITFMSIATPHLGVRRFTIIPLPDLLHFTPPLVIGQTGNDLFLRPPPSSSSNSSSSSSSESDPPLLLKMASEKRFLEPLAAFKYRRAYGNLKDDMLVPFGTALFHPEGPTGGGEESSSSSSSRSSYGGSFEQRGHVLKETLMLPTIERNDVKLEVWEIPRREWVQEEEGRERGVEGGKRRSSRAAVGEEERERRGRLASIRLAAGGTLEGEDEEWMEEAMAARLNSLGWEKVAVTFRAPFWSAHNTICALSRSRVGTYLFKKGRSVMDHAAGRIARAAAEEEGR